MVHVYLQGPEWFFGADASIEAFAALIAFFVAFASLRVYNITKERKYAFFTASMVLLTLSFLSRAIADILLEELIWKVPSTQAGLIFLSGYVSHILLDLIAYALLVIITHKISDKRVIALLFIIMIPSMLLSGSYFVSFYGLSFILLSFVTFAYLENCRKVRKTAASCVFIAFLLLTIVQLFFLLEPFYSALYVAAHVAQAAGYFVLLFALIRTLYR